MSAGVAWSELDQLMSDASFQAWEMRHVQHRLNQFTADSERKAAIMLLYECRLVTRETAKLLIEANFLEDA